MAITLESVADAGASPIANNTASAIAFANNYAKLATLSRRDVLTIVLIQMIHYVADGGEDYRTNHPGLIQDAAVYTKGINIELDVFAALGAIFQVWATQVNNGMSSDVEAILAEGRDLANLSEDQLIRILALIVVQT